MTPAPDPSYTPEQALGISWGLGIAVLALAAVGFLFVWALLIVSKREPGAMLAVSISLLTLTSISVYALTQSEVMGTLAATGMGALAGSLTALFRAQHVEQTDEDPPVQNPESEGSGQ